MGFFADSEQACELSIEAFLEVKNDRGAGEKASAVELMAKTRARRARIFRNASFAISQKPDLPLIQAIKPRHLH